MDELLTDRHTPARQERQMTESSSFSRYENASETVRSLLDGYGEIDLAEMLADARATIARLNAGGTPIHTLDLIESTITGLIPGARPGTLTVHVTENYDPFTTNPMTHTWQGTPLGLAERICTALFSTRSHSEQQVSAPPQVDESSAERCQVVQVDGDSVLVRGEGEMDEEGAAHFGEVIRAARCRYEAEHPDAAHDVAVAPDPGDASGTFGGA